MLKLLYGLLFLVSLVIFIIIFASNVAMASSYYFYFLSSTISATLVLVLTYITWIATGVFGILFVKSILQNNYGGDDFDL